MTVTRVISRAVVPCYDCGKSHQLRLVDREGLTGGARRTVTTISTREVRLFGVIDAFEEFDLAEAMIKENTKQQGPCPVPGLVGG